RIKPGITTEQVSVTMDWTATILQAAGAKADPGYPLDGIDLMPIMTGKEQPVDRTLYWRTFQRTKYKAIRDGNWKYLYDGKDEFLFDLSKDQQEKNDLKQQNEKKLNELKTKFMEWEKIMLKPIPL
ncbi:MAG TPA: hypothetical protein VHL77_08770, partial [Ferruginibacter sp.]|nr:hypothetical protein [Ferruginibacter sp.]